MLIIIDGVDKVGKTTLARKIATELKKRGCKPKILHAGPPKEHPIIEYEKSIQHYDPNNDDVLILDRWHWGEMVWPFVLGRPSEMLPETFHHIELFLMSRGAVMIHAVGGVDAIKKRIREKNDDMITVDDAEDALKRFRDVAAHSFLPIAKHSIESPADVNNIIRYAEGREDAARKLLSITREVVGETVKPDVLLVGEQRGNLRQDLLTPFVPFPAQSCGGYLLRATQRNWQTYAITNAEVHDVEDGGHLFRLHKLWRRTPVIALGLDASRVLKNKGIPHGQVDHPQYVKRFFNAQDAAYSLALLDAAKGNDARFSQFEGAPA